MRLRDLFTASAVTAAQEDSLRSAAVRMRDDAIGSLMIVRRKSLRGIITESDVVAAVENGRHPLTSAIASCMSTSPATVHPDADRADAALEMINLGIRHLPVVEGDKLLEMVSARDLLAAEAEWPPRRSEPWRGEWATTREEEMRCVREI